MAKPGGDNTSSYEAGISPAPLKSSHQASAGSAAMAYYYTVVYTIGDQNSMTVMLFPKHLQCLRYRILNKIGIRDRA